MSNYHDNKARARTINTKPSMTDQAGARETDLNVIVGRMIASGTAPGNAGPPIYADWTQVPDNLRDLFEMARSMKKHRNALPEPLRNLPVNELLNLTQDEYMTMIVPAQTPTPTETPT